MTPESIVTLSEPDPVPLRRGRLNGWELALWILGAALLAGAVILLTVAAKTLYFPNGTEVSGTETFALIQVASIAIPSLVTAGFISIALAIAIRAVNLNAARRQTYFSETPIRPAAVADVPSSVISTPSMPVATAPEPRAPHDNSIFMRPPTGAAD